MNYGAVVVAAGLSSRMGAFKPLLKLGTQSVVQHVISSFRQAGVDHIAIITGHNAAELKKHLKNADVIFLHNAQYQTTQMFDSAKIGLSYMKECCDRVFFTPVDIPLFTSKTVARLMKSDAALVSPVHEQKQGHPILMSTAVIDTVLQDSGEGGLKGAFQRSEIPMTHVPVNDPGILRDADTPEEFKLLLAGFEQQRKSLYPTDLDIEQMLDDIKTPEPVRAHCKAVARKAAQLSIQIDFDIDFGLLRAACLLHDIARANSGDHAAAAENILQQAGYSLLAQIIGQHHDLRPDPPVEAQLLYLADKLIQDTAAVTLHQRFSASKEKCKTPESLAVWRKRYQDTLQIIDFLHLGSFFDQNGGNL